MKHNQGQARNSYDGDIVAWANEQAALIRAGRFDLLDIEHIADEIEDVGKSEQRELESRMVVLIAHLLKWVFQPERRGASWEATIKVQRDALSFRLKKTPSLKSSLKDEDWLRLVWGEARAQALTETGLGAMPSDWIWTVDQALDSEFWPE